MMIYFDGGIEDGGFEDPCACIQQRNRHRSGCSSACSYLCLDAQYRRQEQRHVGGYTAVCLATELILKQVVAGPQTRDCTRYISYTFARYLHSLLESKAVLENHLKSRCLPPKLI